MGEKTIELGEKTIVKLSLPNMFGFLAALIVATFVASDTYGRLTAVEKKVEQIPKMQRALVRIQVRLGVKIPKDELDSAFNE